MQSVGYKVGVYKPVQLGAIDKEDYLISPDLAIVKMLDPNIITHSTFMMKSKLIPSISAQIENMDINFKMSIGKARKSEKNQYIQNIWKISDLEKELASIGETKTPTELQSVKTGNFRKSMNNAKIDQIAKDTTYRGY